MGGGGQPLRFAIANMVSKMVFYVLYVFMSRKRFKREGLVLVVCLVLSSPLWNRTTCAPKSVPPGWILLVLDYLDVLCFYLSFLEALLTNVVPTTYLWKKNQAKLYKRKSTMQNYMQGPASLSSPMQIWPTQTSPHIRRHTSCSLVECFFPLKNGKNFKRKSCFEYEFS